MTPRETAAPSSPADADTRFSWKATLAQASSLAVSVAVVYFVADGPKALLYAFVLTYFCDLFAITLAGNPARRARSRLAHTLLRFSRPPWPGKKSYPVRHGDAHHGQPTGPLPYFFIMLFVGGLAFVLLHVRGSKNSLDVRADVLARDFIACAMLTLVYFAEHLVARKIVLDPAAPIETNLGYNSKELTVLCLAVLTAPLLLGLHHKFRPADSEWILSLPILLLRHLYEYFEAKDHATGVAPPG